MGLESILEQSVTKAFNALDDLVGEFTITSVANDSYDANTGVVTQTSTPYIVEGAFSVYETDRVDGTIIQAEDRLVLVKPIETFTPKIGDSITGPDGVVYEVMDVEDVKTYDKSFLWELQARK